MSTYSRYFLRETLWPSLLFTIIVMIIGLLGNSLIIYIYRRHFYRSVPWLFIYVLSILDFLACVIAMPSELMILVTFSAFPSNIWCKLSRYLSFTLHGSSCVILMVIALNRYEKVCRPNQQKINLRVAKGFCVGTIIFACVSYIPCLMIYGDFVAPLVKIGDVVKILPHDFNMTHLSDMNLTSNDVSNGTFCSITPEASNGLVVGFYLFQFLLYLSLVILIIFFYSRINAKMVDYSHKQQLLLSQMVPHAKRTDHIRHASIDRGLAVPKDEPTADFSKDFSHSNSYKPPPGEESPVDKLDSVCSDDKNQNYTTKEHSKSDAVRIRISPPVVEEQDLAENPNIRQAESENNIHLLSSSRSSMNNPLETNKLLMRRFKSNEDFKCKVQQLHILPHVDPYEAFLEPLFLHAPKTHKKKEKGSTRKSKKGRSKSVSRSKSNVDVSLRMVKPTKRDGNAKSLEGLATLHCGKSDDSILNNNIQDGTLTLTRRTTPKGSKNCIIPISTTLSMKSVVSYNTLDPGKQSSNQSQISGNESRDTIDTIGRAKESIDKITDDKDERDHSMLNNPADQQLENGGVPSARRETVSFKKAVTLIHEPAKKFQVHLRKRSESSSNAANSRTSENILTPSQGQTSVDYRRRMSVRPIRTNRTSHILFCISLAFVLSFLPFWIIVFARTFIGPDIMAKSTHAELGAMSLFIRFTLISNAINPVIYGLMNSQFRQRCSLVFNRWSQKHPAYN